MDVESQQVPPVVAAMVVHDPGPWFDHVLRSLRAQDYPNLRRLFLVTDTPSAPRTVERIRDTLPNAVVRVVVGNPGFGRAANEVLNLVEGDNGFFLLLHDDVALEPTAVRQLVEELYRSNAGIVGPKLVDWDDPMVLQHVGMAVDRFAAVDPLVEPGERDQEQHDAVRDVFCLPSACLLVRADLFRALGGFDPVLEYHGEDLDLCWRAHLSGARVVVVPSAKARHRERLTERRPDLPHQAMRARHRMRAYATLTGLGRAVMWFPLLVLTTLAELVAGAATGHPGEGWAATRALVGLVPRLGAITVRRNQIRGQRQLPDREVAELQMRGSARRAAHQRRREASARTDIDQLDAQPRGSIAALAAWLVVGVLALFGSRAIITGGVQPVGQMLPFPDSSLWSMFRSGWWTTGLGQPVAHPTGFALAALTKLLALGNGGLALTIGVLGLLPVGYLGFWRLSSSFPDARSRWVGLVTYAAVPLPYAAIGGGRWSVLVCYAAMPWVLHAVYRLSGLRSRFVVPYPGSAEPGVDTEVSVAVPLRTRLRQLAALSLVLAVAGAFEPSIVLIAVVAALAWVLAAAVSRGQIASAGLGLSATVVAALVAFIANMPWSQRYFDHGGWDAIVGAKLASPRDFGVARLARFGIGPSVLGVVAVALYLPVLLGPLIARGWRLPWAARALFLVAPFGALAALDDRGSIGIRLPEPGVLLSPVAVGVAIAAAVMVSVFANDIKVAGFGWRQPAGLLGVLAIIIGIVPGVAATFSGRFSQPHVTLASAVDNLLPSHPPDGEYRVLYLGDPRVVPVASWEFRSGIAYALTDDGPLNLTADWAGIPVLEDRLVRTAVQSAATETTARVGRLLAPLGVRYIVVPLVDRVASTSASPLPEPTGLLDALGDQLDLRRVPSPAELVVYENTAWLPIYSVLSGDAAAATTEAGADALARYDLSGRQPVFTGGSGLSGDIPAGRFHMAVQSNERWRFTVGGTELSPQLSFGYSQVYDVAASGAATLTYRTPATRGLWIGLQVVLWLALLLIASDVLPGLPRSRRSPGVVRPAGAPAAGDELSLTEDWAAPGDPDALEFGDPLFADDADATVKLPRPDRGQP